RPNIAPEASRAKLGCQEKFFPLKPITPLPSQGVNTGVRLEHSCSKTVLRISCVLSRQCLSDICSFLGSGIPARYRNIATLLADQGSQAKPSTKSCRSRSICIAASFICSAYSCPCRGRNPP